VCRQFRHGIAPAQASTENQQLEMQMKIRSNYPGTVFFRFFKPDDKLHIAGFDEGRIHYGEEVDYDVNGFGRYQIEFKHDNLFGEFMLNAGKVYEDDQVFEIRQNGHVVAL
jgi:hypothetical protein